MIRTSLARRIGFAIALTAAAAIGTLVAPVVPVAAKDLMNVFVTNSAAAPVPTSIVGTPSVSVAGMPTVKVENAGEPVQHSIVLSTGGKIDCNTLYEVPAGHRLVVEYINVEAFGLTATNRPHVRVSGTSIFGSVAMPLTAAFGGTWVGSEMVQLFSNTNLSACVFFDEAQGANAASAEIRFSGHLFPLS